MGAALAPKSAMIFFAAPITDLALLLKKPVERMSAASSAWLTAAKSGWRILGEQARSHLIHALSVQLRRKDGGHQHCQAFLWLSAQVASG
jgi:hypothetical protein